MGGSLPPGLLKTFHDMVIRHRNLVEHALHLTGTARHVPVLCSKYGAKHRQLLERCFGVSHNSTSVLAAQMIGQVNERNANRDGSRYSELSPIRKRNERKRLGKKRGLIETGYGAVVSCKMPHHAEVGGQP